MRSGQLNYRHFILLPLSLTLCPPSTLCLSLSLYLCLPDSVCLSSCSVSRSARRSKPTSLRQRIPITHSHSTIAIIGTNKLSSATLIYYAHIDDNIITTYATSRLLFDRASGERSRPGPALSCVVLRRNVQTSPPGRTSSFL